MPQRSQFRRVLAIAGWLLCIVAGICIVADHSSRPGQSASASDRWPLRSSLPAPTTHARLVAFFHPGCLCSRATVHELADIAQRAGEAVEISAVVVPFGGADQVASFEALLGEIPNLSIVLDPHEEVSRQFGVFTSGTVLIYSPDGKLLLDGGITAGRGHEGRNVSSELALEKILLGGERSTRPVFGCHSRRRAAETKEA